MFSDEEQLNPDDNEKKDKKKAANAPKKQSKPLQFPKKPVDYDSGDDYNPADYSIVQKKPSQENFKPGQYVVIKSKTDAEAYALLQVAPTVDISVVAMLRGNDNKSGSGYTSQHPWGLYALVTYVKMLDVVTHFL